MIHKKQFIIILLILIPFYSFSNDAIILEKSGEVTIQNVVETYWAEIGNSLNIGDIISTGKESSAVILISDGTRIDLFSNSRFVLAKQKDLNSDENRLLSKLWQNVKNKFSDVEYSSAQTGSIGAIRGSITDEVIFNDKLSGEGSLELSDTINFITNQQLKEDTIWQLKAIIFEEYGQFIEAEKIYLMLLESNPTDLVLYDMLIDLYLEIDFYAHASNIIKLKEDVL